LKIRVLTLFPELFGPFFAASLIGRARQRGLIDLEAVDLRDFTSDRHRVVDDMPYGGGGGMVMKAEPWLEAVNRLSAAERPWRVLLSPQGGRLDEEKVRELAARDSLLLMCGRYEGVDERVIETVVDEEISIGDFVLSGGELPAMVMIEALSRQIPGVVQLSESVENDSFRRGLLDYPHYTRPQVVAGLEVPAVLLSGDHAKISAWRRQEALRATLRKRPDLLRTAQLEENELRELGEVALSAGLELAPELAARIARLPPPKRRKRKAEGALATLVRETNN
jgi:tRNA (guanine37-N1)-methyltransferase